MRTVLSVFLVILVAALSFPQSYVAGQAPFTKETLLGNSPVLGLKAQGPGSLLDPSRFSMHQSYSMNYMSNGQNSDMTGLYLNRLQYDFQVPVTLQVDVGLFHKPMALMDGRGAMPGEQNPKLTIPRVGLFYQPSEHFSMALEYFNVPAGYGNAMSPFGSSGFMLDDPFAPRTARQAHAPASIAAGK